MLFSRGKSVCFRRKLWCHFCGKASAHIGFERRNKWSSRTLIGTGKKDREKFYTVAFLRCNQPWLWTQSHQKELDKWEAKLLSRRTEKANNIESINAKNKLENKTSGHRVRVKATGKLGKSIGVKRYMGEFGHSLRIETILKCYAQFVTR